LTTTAIHLYLDELTARLGNALATRLVGVYLTGSAAVGAFRAGQSDLDVLVVADGAQPAQLDAIVRTCSHEALPCPASKLELVVYERAALERPGELPRWSLNLDTGAREQHVGVDPELEPSHWFVLDLEFARRHAVALTGPPPAELIGETPRETLRAAFTQAVDWYDRNEPGPPAEIARRRAAHWERTGEFASKADVSGASEPPSASSA
jgi:hypothetical protein